MTKKKTFIITIEIEATGKDANDFLSDTVDACMPDGIELIKFSMDEKK